MEFDDLIIGAGYSGLSLAALLSKINRRVCVLEAHSMPGGCAGYFKRGEFLFDVGATTLSGLGANMPLRQLCNTLEIVPEVRKLDRPMEITLSDGKKLTRFSETERWIDELEEKFPGIEHRKFWTHLDNIATRAWSLLDDAANFPPTSLRDLVALIKPKLILNSDLALDLFKPLESLLPANYKSGSLRHFIDEQLLISTQSYAKDVPILMGALGLTYPSDMYYPFGGITSLAKKLEEYILSKGGEIHYRTYATAIKDDLTVFTNKADYRAKRVISTIPIWNLVKLNQSLTTWEKDKTKNISDPWSAVTMNLAIKSKTPIFPLYHQVHLENAPSWASSCSLFISFSDSNDQIRAPQGWQTVTISTHVRPHHFPDKKSDRYKLLKNEIESELLGLLKRNFPSIEDFKFVSVGTPHTFERFTMREKGLVGGIPHSIHNPAWQWPTSTTPIENLYHLGDTSFPGQGIVGVVQGAMNFVKKHHGCL